MSTESSAHQSRSPRGLPVPEELARESLPAPPTSGETSPVAATVPEPLRVSPQDLDHRLQFAEQTHQYIREFIRLADQKAAFFFTAATALLAFLYKANVSARWLKPILTWNILDMAAFLAMLTLGISGVLALLVVIPRTPGSRRGYLFWEAIAEFDASRRYADDLTSLSPATLLQVKLEHCHELATVCRKKYRALVWALWIGTVGLVASVLVFLFSR